MTEQPKTKGQKIKKALKSLGISILTLIVACAISIYLILENSKLDDYGESYHLPLAGMLFLGAFPFFIERLVNLIKVVIKK